MFEALKDIAKKIISSRLFVFSLVMILLFGVLLQRVFFLQIVNGKEYEDKYSLTIEKERTISGTRGNIFDRNGKLLAYNELSYTVTIEDSGVYENNDSKNSKLNAQLYDVIHMIEDNGDTLSNDFSIQMDERGELEFNISDSALQRFRADVYGYSKTEDLKKNKNKLGYSEEEATPRQIFDYLRSDKKFGIRIEGVDTPTEKDKKYGHKFFSMEDAYKILVIRYFMNQNNYQKYILVTIAQGVSEETVATIKENSDRLEGVDVTEDTIRKYVDSEYFSHIIGYTGKISQEEYDELVKENDSYTLTDIVGKSGIEKEMESVLQGSKGYEKFYVDNVGRVVEIKDLIQAASGQDVYLSIDSDLQIAVYHLLEQQIAGIVYAKIENIKEYNADSNSSAADIVIPIDDVYFALINNNIIDIASFSDEDASSVEQAVYQAFLNKQASVLAQVNEQLSSPTPANYEDLSDEMQAYMSHILNMLTEQKIVNTSAIDTDSEVYQNWKNDKLSLAEYLRYGISNEWIDITGFETDSKYSDTMELYDSLLQYIQEQLKTDKSFSKKLYKYMIRDNMVDGVQICLILFEQGILPEDGEKYAGLSNGSINGFDFMREKIKNLEITPAQLALDPCTGSSVIIQPQTGEVLACVSYPGYDTNRLANNMDNEYFNKLRDDLTSPMYSNATQQRTAPGSTFKPVTAAAALTEGIIGTTDQIEDKGKFELVQDGPKCWIYPNSTHGNVNVSEAIRDSCNYFFYTLGYNMSLNGETYQESKGIAALEKYAKMFGLGDKTGIEVPESEPQVSDVLPIPSAIGQGTHNFTTTQLARYTAAIASSGKVYQLTLLDKVTDSQGNLVTDYKPEVISDMEEINPFTWDAIHQGMRMMVEDNRTFEGFSETIAVAGKTGTAQQITTRPNHALFIGYAPYDNPEIAIATRIAYGYTSANAVEVSRDILEYYFHLTDEKDLINGQAQDVGNSANSVTD
ncbi:MAG: peptidoglycan glycosyltransferase [Lachnospiraceae bacterium]|nr:peptidoglycan glycosyltransferase [Lachnospiraceae bacterium]